MLRHSECTAVAQLYSAIITLLIPFISWREVKALNPITADRRLAAAGASVRVVIVAVIARLNAALDKTVSTGRLYTPIEAAVIVEQVAIITLLSALNSAVTAASTYRREIAPHTG